MCFPFFIVILADRKIMDTEHEKPSGFRTHRLLGCTQIPLRVCSQVLLCVMNMLTLFQHSLY